MEEGDSCLHIFLCVIAFHVVLMSAAATVGIGLHIGWRTAAVLIGS